ncbi:MAG TPA: hypothetical protein VLA88_03245 [Candidatus Saccharimonadales bacterium]|nr:hypothetical protein [Candidatus Saccharimonadales bacterium]
MSNQDSAGDIGYRAIKLTVTAERMIWSCPRGDSDIQLNKPYLYPGFWFVASEESGVRTLKVFLHGGSAHQVREVNITTDGYYTILPYEVRYTPSAKEETDKPDERLVTVVDEKLLELTERFSPEYRR